MTIVYASGRNAWGTCQKCGLRFKYSKLVNDGYFKDLRVCPQCYDGPHPQERLVDTADPVALYRPSPDTIHPPTAVTLAVSAPSGLDRLFTWTESESQDGLIAGYRLYASADGGETYGLLATIELERAFDTTTTTELEYLAEDLDPSTTYSFYLVAYDTRGLTSSPSNVVTTTTGAS